MGPLSAWNPAEQSLIFDGQKNESVLRVTKVSAERLLESTFHLICHCDELNVIQPY